MVVAYYFWATCRPIVIFWRTSIRGVGTVLTLPGRTMYMRVSLCISWLRHLAYDI